MTQSTERVLSVSDLEDMRRTVIEDALDAALPLLIRLGDFIGNGEDAPPHGMKPYDRGDVIYQVRQALELHRCGYLGSQTIYWMTDGIEWARGRMPDLPEDIAYSTAVGAAQAAFMADPSLRG